MLETTGSEWPRLLGGAGAVVDAVVALCLVWLLTTWAMGRS
ncbi:hypothetical protein [Nocardia bhagyanarayanae]|uniref:Uncharacterized protein n=1 Tax=Nocardia bhagyanarayanae TaxID=1215925 RepID=A0A543EUY1_9NOCA|nr:hypothetical protein [Nocardia bhagyanarayanae]TQM25371.1 hypothetical protein FB390_5519 [Nocardia bhagyanarayanae]